MAVTYQTSQFAGAVLQGLVTDCAASTALVAGCRCRLQLAEKAAVAGVGCDCGDCTAHWRIVVVHLVHGETLLNLRGEVAGGALEGTTAAVILHVPI